MEERYDGLASIVPFQFAQRARRKVAPLVPFQGGILTKRAPFAPVRPPSVAPRALVASAPRTRCGGMPSPIHGVRPTPLVFSGGVASRTVGFGDDEYDGMAGLGDLGNPFKKIGKWAKKQYGKGPSVSGLKSSVKGTMHTAGKVLDNKIVKGVAAGALALTGVGAPAAAGIMAGMGVAGGAMKKGGGLKEAVRRGYQGAVIGTVAAVAPTVAKKGFGLAKKGAGAVVSAGKKILTKSASTAATTAAANVDPMVQQAVNEVLTNRRRP